MDKINNKLTLIKKDLFSKLFDFIKTAFGKKNIKNTEETINIKLDDKKRFLENISFYIDEKLKILKLKLDSGQIKAIDLSDEQIDKLQLIYDEEISQREKRILKLKK